MLSIAISHTHTHMHSQSVSENGYSQQVAVASSSCDILHFKHSRCSVSIVMLNQMCLTTVCCRAVCYATAYQTTSYATLQSYAATQSYQTYYSYSCGWWGWRRCGGSNTHYRTVTAYRYVTAYTPGSIQVSQCCSGYSGSAPNCQRELLLSMMRGSSVSF